MEEMIVNLDFYKGKNVFITGHTGFKGSWLCEILTLAGANVTGYALDPPTEPSLFNLSGVDSKINSVIGDIRDFDKLKTAFDKAKPQIVLHLAAQPIVRESYAHPRYTYETNVMGTVNILECVRLSDSVKSFVNVTTDKVYRNNEWEWGYRESDPLDGYDPYSNSKSCSELVTHSYINSFFSGGEAAVSTARAGNAIGGGDFAKDRILPDCVRAAIAGEKIIVRNPYSTRPYQHVLDVLFAYLMIAQKQYEDKAYAGYYNIGSDDCDCISTGSLVQIFCDMWGDMLWESGSEENAPYEANSLKLDCSKLKEVFGWYPRWHIDEAVAKTIEWTKVYLDGGDIEEIMRNQIKDFYNYTKNLSYS